jgi:hypothetical protein
VVVGGSSVLMGAGQPIRHLWTKKLQQELGDGYCVFNLATPGGGLAGYASVAMEMLAKEYADAYLVSDSHVPQQYPPDGRVWFKHFFWDAYYKGLLKNSPVKREAERMEQIDKGNARDTPADRARTEQVRLGMWVDSYLYFNDLWTWFHYNHHMTIFSPALASYNWGPRKVLPDYDYEADLNEARKLKQYPAEDSSSFKSELAVVRRFLKNMVLPPEGPKLGDDFVAMAESAVRDYAMTDYAGKILITIVPDSPYYLDRLPPGEREIRAYRSGWEMATFEKYGYRTVMLDNVLAEDFADRPHLNTFGGNKLAAKVAERIKSLKGEVK